MLYIYETTNHMHGANPFQVFIGNMRVVSTVPCCNSDQIIHIHYDDDDDDNNNDDDADDDDNDEGDVDDDDDDNNDEDDDDDDDYDDEANPNEGGGDDNNDDIDHADDYEDDDDDDNHDHDDDHDHDHHHDHDHDRVTRLMHFLQGNIPSSTGLENINIRCGGIISLSLTTANPLFMTPSWMRDANTIGWCLGINGSRLIWNEMLIRVTVIKNNDLNQIY